MRRRSGDATEKQREHTSRRIDFRATPYLNTHRRTARARRRRGSQSPRPMRGVIASSTTLWSPRAAARLSRRPCRERPLRREKRPFTGSRASTAGGTIVSITTTSVIGILSTLSAALITTIVTRVFSNRVPGPSWTRRAPHDPGCSPRERHVSDASGYRTVLPSPPAWPASSRAVFDPAFGETTEGALQQQGRQQQVHRQQALHLVDRCDLRAARAWRGASAQGTEHRDNGQRGNHE